MGMTVLQIADRLRSEADAHLYLEELRWGDGEPVCPHCDCIGATYIRPSNGVSRKTRTGAMSERRVWRCLSCRKQFSVLTGTIFHGTKVPVRIWVLLIFEMCANKNGIAAREVERKYGVCPRTAWHVMHRIREAMKNDALVGSMRGVIVADETFIGGAEKNKHEWKRSHPGGGTGGKTAVLSLIEKHSGEVRSRVVPDVTGATLQKAIEEVTDPAVSLLYTDEHTGYVSLGRRFLRHESVTHSRREYVRGDVTTNMAEGFFSQLKRSLDGTHHHVSREHLPRYLVEFDFRYSTRKESDTARMHRLMKQTGGRRLTYKRIKS